MQRMSVREQIRDQNALKHTEHSSQMAIGSSTLLEIT